MNGSQGTNRHDLHSFGQALVESRGKLPELLRVIAAQVVDVVGEGCVLTTVDESGTRLEAAAVMHRDPAVAEAMRAATGGSIAIGEGLAGTAAAERRALVVNDVTPTVIRDAVADRFTTFADEHPIRSIVIVPMVSAGTLMGTLGAIRTTAGRPYTSGDVRLMEALADRAALAIADTMASPRRIGFEDYEALFVHSRDGLLITAPDGQILAANPAMCEMVGRSERELIDGGRDAIVVAEDPRLRQALEERAAVGSARSELTLRRGDGSMFQADVSSTIYTTPLGTTRACMVVRDVDQQARNRADAAARLSDLEQRVDLDPMTGLWNRYGWSIAAEQALASADRQGLRVQLLFLDLDDLKLLNDTHGHAAGDAAISSFGEALRTILRDADVAARVGGDEFLVLLVDATPQDIESFVGRLYDELGRTWRAPVPPTFSIGNADRFARSGTTLAELVESADQAMYANKVLRRSAKHR
jgi:diguanylate cyclase (GGDEF)-like protein/PAS domain S-box-containing protein